jgi:hypothetical protein
VSKECTKCLKLNKEGATIPESVIKSHNAADCYVDPKKYKDNKKSSDSKPDNKAFWDKSIKNLVTKVNQISLAVKDKSSKTSGKKSKTTKSSKDNDSDDDDEEA